MNSDRLMRLVQLLKDNAANPTGAKFDLNAWGNRIDSNKAMPVDCGTTACAFGLAAISDIFKDEGLTYDWSLTYSGAQGFIIPMFNGLKEFAAAAKFFGLTKEGARHLFDPDYYDEEQIGAEGELFVAQRIEDLVATNGRVSDRNFNAVPDPSELELVD